MVEKQTQGAHNEKIFLIGFSVLLAIFQSSGVLAIDRVVVIPLGGTETDSNLIPENICFGITIFGITGTTLCTPAVTSAGGQIWMDRNLGASQVATSSIDTLAFGDLYQWGRLADGHEKRTSSIISDLSATDVPGHGEFIVAPASPFDWRDPQENTLWQGVSGINNPCPSGFRLPTIAEWEIERLSWSTKDAAGAIASPLKLVVGGVRTSASGALFFPGVHGLYWSSMVSGTSVRMLFFNNTEATNYDANRANAYSVRCIKD